MTRPEISCIAPLFIVRDVPVALAFYRDRLGFDITFQGPEPDDIFFGIVERGAAMIMFKAVGVDPVPNCTRDVKQGIARWDAYVGVPDPDALAAEFASRSAAFKQQLSALLKDSGYPTSADPDGINYGVVFLLLFILSVLGVMTYGPIAAWLVELFPARIRYTSMSLPYHLGNGWFGGFLPSIAFAMIAYTGNIYSGLWYPVIVCVMTLIVGTFFLRETHGNEAV